MKKTYLTAVFMVLAWSAGVCAQEPAGTVFYGTEAVILDEEKYIYPILPPELTVSGGYRFVYKSGAASADEYEYLNNSVVLRGDIRLFKFPHRFHLNFDMDNVKDYFGDLNYAYKDILVFRAINRTLFHNLDNLRLIDTDSGNSRFEVFRKDAGREYGIRTGINDLFLRLKAPDFPLHIYVEGMLIDRKGTRQMRSQLGVTDSSSKGTLTSRSRDIDFKTRTLTVGANSHLGPIEVDISHSEKWFDVRDGVLFDSYDAVALPARAAGVYPHNLIPELRGTTNTMKLHSSYTGGLVASATVSKMVRYNRDSGARADYFIGAGEITWIASPNLTFLVKYRHKDTDTDNPDTVRITDRSNPANTYVYAVKDSISSVTNTVSGIVRYRPDTGIIVRGEFIHEEISRSHADDWGWGSIPDNTIKNISSLSADVRILKGVNLKLKYIHRDINNPAYNIEPDYSNEYRASLSWVPVPKLDAFLSYTLVKERRRDMGGFVEPAERISIASDRDVRRDRLMGTVTYAIIKDLSLTGSYFYMHNRIEQDIAVGDIDDQRVPNTISSYSYAADLSYAPANALKLAAGLSHTVSSGKFTPQDPALHNPSIGSFSELKIRETVYSALAEYQFRRGFSAGLQYKLTQSDDVLNNPYDDVRDGKVHILFLTLSMKW